MGQKDQVGYYSEKCHFFSTLKFECTNLTTVQIKSKKKMHYFVYKSQYMLTKYGPILFQNNDFYQQKKVQYMTLLLIRPVLKMVYLGSDIEKKMTTFCLIFILVLLSHID